MPSNVAEGSQYVTNRIGAALQNTTKPTKKIADTVCEPVSNILGMSSRLLGKKVEKSGDLIFLYGRSLDRFDDRHKETVKEIISYMLTNTILYPKEMADDNRRVDKKKLPNLNKVAADFKNAGATPSDIFGLIKLLSVNGLLDIPEELADKMKTNGIMKNGEKFKVTWLIEELIWIKEKNGHLYKLDRSEKSDYKLMTKYKDYETIRPLIYEKTENKNSLQ